MPHEADKNNHVAGWLRVINEDLLMAEKGLEQPLAIGGTVYHCQQAVEKALKLYLISNGELFPRTHDLLRLLQLCEKLDDDLKELREAAEFLNPFASITRYPEYGDFPTVDEARYALELATNAVHFIKRRLPPIYSSEEPR
jgi:HEPN domain-containing protein